MAGNHNCRIEKSPVAFDKGYMAAKEEVCILSGLMGLFTWRASPMNNIIDSFFKRLYCELFRPG